MIFSLHFNFKNSTRTLCNSQRSSASNYCLGKAVGRSALTGWVSNILEMKAYLVTIEHKMIFVEPKSGSKSFLSIHSMIRAPKKFHPEMKKKKL